MNKVNVGILGASLVALTTGLSQTTLAADSISEALSEGTAYGKFRLRYEAVEQNNILEDAKALTLRTVLGYKTGSVNGFSAVLQVEDVRSVLGQADFNDKVNGQTQFSVIADPESTEIDQGFIQYKNDLLTAKFGTQVFTLDGHRFLGHVGWRQDWLTFDAATVVAKPTEGLTVTAGYLYGRNGILADTADQKSKDVILNASYKVGDSGKLVAYSYNLEEDDAVAKTNDTFGVSYDGAVKMDSVKILYGAEYASQTSNTGVVGAADAEPTYTRFELGAVVSGVVVKVMQETLGSDNGVGFATPLATLHKWNGWGDQFLATPGQGLVDANVRLISKVGPGKLMVIYHDFSADEGVAGADDFGTEFDLDYTVKFGKKYSLGLRYIDYSAEDIKVDTEKLWLSANASF